MIKYYLNTDKYRYDVYHIISLFYDFSNITYVAEENNANLLIYITDKIVIRYNEKSETYNLQGFEAPKEEIKLILFKFLKDIVDIELPWGTLIGIRPTKIILTLMNKGYSDNEIIEYLKTTRLTDEKKIQLCIDIVKNEQKILNMDSKCISVYINMPFCPTKCAYCSFTSNPIGTTKKYVEPYIEALFYEIEKVNQFIVSKNLKIQNVYFGGGTPTAVSEEQFERVLKKIHESFIKNNSILEFTVECGRPDSMSFNKLKTMKNYEVNRISINPQSMNDLTLKKIGRNHSSKDIIEMYHLARSIGFDNINMDLIAGLPDEGIDDVIKTCKEIEMLSPDSITVHGMSLKKGSTLHEKSLSEKIENNLGQNEIINIYDTFEKYAKIMKMKPYYLYRQKNMFGNMENTGYCKEGKEGIYNIQMIEETQSIIAIGTDAATKAVFHNENRIERHFNLKDIIEYINRVSEMVDKKLILLNELFR